MQHQHTSHAVKIVVHGTSIAIALLSLILVGHSVIFAGGASISHIASVLSGGLYAALCEYTYRRGWLTAASWLVIAFYQIAATLTMLAWGVNAPIGILTISFCVALASLLIGRRAILPTFTMVTLLLFFVYAVHRLGLIEPRLAALAEPAVLFDILTYLTVIGIFALISWVASKQREQHLGRALAAEYRLTLQKEHLRKELEKESAMVRIKELEHIDQLQKFAFLGQTAAATLHDLSTQLSTLNLDIDDIDQKASNSHVIESARENIASINHSIHQVRQQLHSNTTTSSFKVRPVIEQNLRDMERRSQPVQLRLDTDPDIAETVIKGSPLLLSQVMYILVTNAAQSCRNQHKPKVNIEIHQDEHAVHISVKDNGAGIPRELSSALYMPKQSHKTSGMGLGLYIAKHLVQDQLHGTIQHLPTKKGAHFQITLPRTSPTP